MIYIHSKNIVTSFEAPESIETAIHNLLTCRDDTTVGVGYPFSIIPEIYEQGLNDAWELAKKVVLNENESGMSLGDLNKAFGDFSYYCILRFFSGVEAWSAYNKFLKSKRIEEELKVKTRIESITETATEVTFTLTDGTKRVISIDDITSGSDMKIVTESGCYEVFCEREQNKP